MINIEIWNTSFLTYEVWLHVLKTIKILKMRPLFAIFKFSIANLYVILQSDFVRFFYTSSKSKYK